jgi:hypothetical protein
MLEQYDLEPYVKKYGAFHYTVLIQKRLKELKLISFKSGHQQKTDTLIELVMKEILEDKIQLIAEEEEKIPELSMQDIMADSQVEEGDAD